MHKDLQIHSDAISRSDMLLYAKIGVEARIKEFRDAKSDIPYRCGGWPHAKAMVESSLDGHIKLLEGKLKEIQRLMDEEAYAPNDAEILGQVEQHERCIIIHAPKVVLEGNVNFSKEERKDDHYVGRA